MAAPLCGRSPLGSAPRVGRASHYGRLNTDGGCAQQGVQAAKSAPQRRADNAPLVSETLGGREPLLVALEQQGKQAMGGLRGLADVPDQGVLRLVHASLPDLHPHNEGMCNAGKERNARMWPGALAFGSS